MPKNEIDQTRRQFITQSAGIIGAAGLALSGSAMSEQSDAEKSSKKDRYGIKGHRHQK